MVLLLAGAAAPVAAIAAQATTSQGYSSKSALGEGTLVSLSNSDAQTIEAATLDNRDKLLGIAIKPTQALVNLEDGANNIQVVATGQVSVRVSTANGEIKPGDALSPSPIAGVAMKAINSGKIIGTAQDGFTKNSKNTKAIELTNDQGGTQLVVTGKIVASLSVEDWTPNGPPNSTILNAVRSFLGSAVGKPVSNGQALLSIGIMLFAGVIACIIMYSAVSSSIHSIGRNPLSKNIIKRSLFVMISLSLVIVVTACLAVYLILGGA